MNAVALTEGEGVCLGARVQELDLERVIALAFVLTHKLVQPVPRDRAEALRVGIEAVVREWRPAIDAHSKAHRSPVSAGAQHEVNGLGH